VKSRAPDDHDGHLIDAAERVYLVLVEEATNLARDGHSGSAFLATGELVHAVTMHWIDVLGNQRLTRRDSAMVEGITRLLGRIAGEAQARRERRC